MKLSLCIFLLTATYFKTYSQVTTDSVLIDDHYRSFHFNKPQKKIKNYNLVFVLHGSGWNGKMMMKFTTKLEEKSTNEHILLVYPDGYKKTWNNCRIAIPVSQGEEDINEHAFFNAMIHYFGKNYKLNTNQAFAIGISAGGLMAYKLAMTMPEKFKAISAIVANLTDTIHCNQLLQPVAVMITNGTKDPVNPYGGGKVVMNGKTLGVVRSTDNTFHYWASLAGYTGLPRVEEVPHADTISQSITRYTYSDGRKPEVTLLQVHEMGHDNPKALDIFIESWAFFKREMERQNKKPL